MFKEGLTMKKQENEIIYEIAKRGSMLTGCSLLDFAMDIEAVHTRCGGLRLQDFLDADNVNFLHDLAGIRQNLNRDTIKLENCFVPRYAKRES